MQLSSSIAYLLCFFYLLFNRDGSKTLCGTVFWSKTDSWGLMVSPTSDLVSERENDVIESNAPPRVGTTTISTTCCGSERLLATVDQLVNCSCLVWKRSGRFYVKTCFTTSCVDRPIDLCELIISYERALIAISLETCHSKLICCDRIFNERDVVYTYLKAVSQLPMLLRKNFFDFHFCQLVSCTIILLENFHF